MKEYLRRRLYIKKTQVGKNAAREASCKRAYRLHATALHRTLCAWDRIPVLHHMHEIHICSYHSRKGNLNPHPSSAPYAPPVKEYRS